MNPLVAAAASELIGEIADLSAQAGRRVDLDARSVCDRSDSVRLREPGLVSPNGACRLLRAADGWIALNLARPEDADLVLAWTFGAAEGRDWRDIARYVAKQGAQVLVADGSRLSLPVARVGEVEAEGFRPKSRVCGTPASRSGRLRVVDLSSLWAGPLCGAVFAAMGADVVKHEAAHRPDAIASAHALRLNGAKQRHVLDWRTAEGRARVWDEICAADVLLTSSRPRGCAQFDLTIETLFARNPACVWIAVSGYGWLGEHADRVAFGDDAAASGALLDFTTSGEPRFLGDAVADPLTGLAAAAGGLRALLEGGGRFVDASMAHCAAGAARARALAA